MPKLPFSETSESVIEPRTFAPTLNGAALTAMLLPMISLRWTSKRSPG